MRAPLVILAAVTLVHLLAQGSAPGGVVADLTQVLLVPALACVLLTSVPTPDSRLVRLVLLALGLSWLGDTLPRFADDGSQLGFLLMIVPFFLAQVAYIAAFLPFVRASAVHNRPVVLAYLLAYLLFVALFTFGAGAIWPSVVYGGVVVAMALLATGIDRVAAVGGILFVISDALIGVRTFLLVELPLHGVWVMLTYVLAQALLVVAVAHHERAVAARRA